MDQVESADWAADFVKSFFLNVLRRAPTPRETNFLRALITQYSSDPVSAISVLASTKYVQDLLGVKVKWTPGHFHSPIPDPAKVQGYVVNMREQGKNYIDGIPIDLHDMRNLWLKNLDCVKASPFAHGRTPGNRYSAEAGPYPMGDAVVLRMMINNYRPRRIIEIGSGCTTACILDSLEHFKIEEETEVTCIEPFPKRLIKLIKPSDLERITLIESPVQEVGLEIFDSLSANDLLVIDSTHVLKAGSDVHYELFYILPRIPVGTLVHFHDIRNPFEYPHKMIEENFAWNEAYALRAFLMYNNDFRVKFWNSRFAPAYIGEISAECPQVFPNPGSAIWIERVSVPTQNI